MENTSCKKIADPPASIAQQKNELLNVLQNYLIPWVKVGNCKEYLILGMPPLQAVGGISVTSHYRPSIQTSNSGRHSTVSNPDAAEFVMRALRFPRLAFVFQGEADLRVGVTPADLPRNTDLTPQLSHQVASLPARHAIIFPSGVPLDTIPFPHWFRPELENAASHIFWLVVLPGGMLIHTCTTRGESHSRSAELYVKSAQLFLLTEQLVDELRTQQLRYELVAQNYLVTILALIERALLNERAFFSPSESALSDNEGHATFSAESLTQSAFQRACNFIETHVHERLTPKLIARHALVSPTHLNRIFRDERHTSVMRYVASHRIAVARLLLRETQLPINEVATIVGIPDHAVFNRTFRREVQISPAAYRKANFS